MVRLKILMVAVACTLSFASCKWSGPRYYDKPQYRNDPSTIAQTEGVPPGISQLLCEHGRAVHHPYKYLDSCARPDVEPVIEITGDDRDLLVRN